MEAEDTVLEGCEIICIGNAIPPTDLIECPLSVPDQSLCRERQQYLAGKRTGIREGLRLANEIGLDHFIGNFLTGEHHPTCKACQLLKEWEIE